jgi:AcrR family transcriptional regulator
MIRATAGLLGEGAPLTMRAVATAAGVGRSTLYRQFDNPADLQRAVQEHALAQAAAAVEGSLRKKKALLAEVRGVVCALVETGAQWPIDTAIGPPTEESLAQAGAALGPVIERLAGAADLAPPAGRWLEAAIADFVGSCLRAGWHSPRDIRATAEQILRAITEPLDRGLLVVDADGAIVTINGEAREAVGRDDAKPGDPVAVSQGGVYEDGSPASPSGHPLTAALATDGPQAGVRGHTAPAGELRWYSIDVRPMRHAPDDRPYGFIAIFTEVTEHKRSERDQLRAPGELGAAAPPLIDIVRTLDEIPPPLIADQLVAEAMRVTGGPVALYVVDIDGSQLRRLAGREDFPEWLRAPLALGPELAEDGLSDLAAQLDKAMPGVAMAPMWLRGRAVGVLLALRNARAGLREVARVGGAALELANGYTDVIDAARRRKDMDPAAELQQSLIPPRIARVGGGEIAGSVMPSYDVGGDWFDYVENRDGTWIAIADAAGRGAEAGALGGVALAALRAARRNDATLDEAAQVVHETMCDVGGPEFFLTAVIARWSGVYSVLSWINCGHPAPLLLRADGSVAELATRPDLPLGVFERSRTFHRHQRRLEGGDRLVLYSDGVARRRTADGLFGSRGIARAAAGARGASAAAVARAIQEAVVSASEDPLPDDAAVVVLAVATT